MAGMILKAIKKELDRRGLSSLWLAKKQLGAHEATCQAYLYTGRDARVSTVEAMLRKLKLTVASAGELARLRESAKAADELRRLFDIEEAAGGITVAPRIERKLNGLLNRIANDNMGKK